MGEAFAHGTEVNEKFWAQTESTRNILQMDTETAMEIYAEAVETLNTNIL